MMPDLTVSSLVEKELIEFSTKNVWNMVYQRIRNEASLLAQYASTADARSLKNQSKNRYKDVSPYDHTRVKLRSAPNTDYINASHMVIPKARGSRYILTQNPLPDTGGHFWLMMWEQDASTIVMLNRLVEKGVVKGHPYFPETPETDAMSFEDIHLTVRCESITHCSFYVLRVLCLDNTQMSESRQIRHYQYLTWPDFGVPRSPGAFLNFLWAVRGCDTDDLSTRPLVVHCSAGIGRSGTFVLVNSALYMIEDANSLDCVNLRDLVIELRQQRMGLIQSHEQLTFSYQAVVEGGKQLLSFPETDRSQIEFPMLEEFFSGEDGQSPSMSRNSASLVRRRGQHSISPPQQSPSGHSPTRCSPLSSHSATPSPISRVSPVSTHFPKHSPISSQFPDIYTSTDSDISFEGAPRIINGREKVDPAPTREMKHHPRQERLSKKVDEIRQKMKQQEVSRSRNTEIFKIVVASLVVCLLAFLVYHLLFWVSDESPKTPILTASEAQHDLSNAKDDIVLY